MKKKIVMILLIAAMEASIITGCGNDAVVTNKVQEARVDTENSQGENDSTFENEVDGIETAEPITEPTPTAEPTPEPVPTPEPTPELEQAVTDEWVVDLYNALVKDDYREVIELLGDIPNAREKCEPYKDEGWSIYDGETAYSMLMEDGETMTVTISDWEIWAFVMYDREGKMIVKGDHAVHLNEDGTFSYIKDGNEVISAETGQVGFVFDDEWIGWMCW